MLEATGIQLRFVTLDSLLPHEEDDPLRVRRLIMALERDGKLRNPPIVAEHGDYYILLDGATRASALREMRFCHVLVQVVGYYDEGVRLSAWHHVVAGLPPNHLLASLADVDGVTLQPVGAGTADRMLDDREIMACVIMPNGQRFAVLCEGDNCERARLLCQLVGEYRGKAEVHRTAELDLPTLMAEYRELTAVIAFPSYTPDEIVEIALNGAKVPMGISRHLVSGRALGLNIPLDMLRGMPSLEEKNLWLQELIRMRLKTDKIRLYQEPVFVFDE